MNNAPGYALVARPFNTFSMGFGGERFFRVYREGEYLLFVSYPGRSKWQLLQTMPQFTATPMNVKVVWNDSKKRYLKAS